MLTRTTPTTHKEAQRPITIRRRRNNCNQTRSSYLSQVIGNRNSSPPVAATLINNINAIFFGASKLIVSQPQEPSFSSKISRQTQNHQLSSIKSVTRATVPNSNGFECNHTRVKLSSSSIKGHPVNSKANNNIRKLRHYSGSITPRSATMYNMITTMNCIYCLILVVCALSLSTQFALADSALQMSAQKLKISPDIINIPSYLNTIKVELHGNNVKPGDPVPAKNFKDLNMAKISWDIESFEARHTLLLLDLDRKPAGSNATNNGYNQFTSLNIPGNAINAGQAIVAFETPVVPCQPSAKHRIVMLAYHQGQNIDISDVAYMSASSGQSSKRENFKLDEFVNRHRLELVAANVFQAIGETNGICSASSSLHSLQSVPSILIAMVMAVTVAFRISKNGLYLMN